MSPFDVLDRERFIQNDLLLEASAGTGKTFSIEHIVVRLLIENRGSPPPQLEEILVVTFTRAAARDLKARIRATLIRTLDQLQALDEGRELVAPNFVLAYAGDKKTERKEAIRSLQGALLVYDRASIFTIHRFCAQMLQSYPFQGDIGLHALKGIEPLSKKEGLQVVRDFFRTELNLPRYHPKQIKQVLALYEGSLEKLEGALLGMVSRGSTFESVPDFTEMVVLFQEEMQRLKTAYSLSAASIQKDFESIASSLSGIRNRQRQVKPEVRAQVDALSRCFDQEEWTKEDFEQVIEEQLELVNRLPVELEWVAPLRAALLPLISPHRVFYKMAADASQLWKKRFSEEEKLGFDELLHGMSRALGSEPFLQSVRQAFQMAIIDEFQDTDPIQWEIFKQAFYRHVPLVLVGDPKQSIYAFRNADIYTYLEASTLIPEGAHGTLETNYRSQPSLVSALNALFSAPDLFMELPRLGRDLPFSPVRASTSAACHPFTDEEGAIHFMIVKGKKGRTLQMEKHEKECFFPTIVREILSLDLPYNEIAILVADRYQADRVFDYLHTHGIPALLQRTESIRHSAALPALREVLEAVLNPRDLSALKRALGGRLFGWSVEDLVTLEAPLLLDPVLIQFYALQEVLHVRGVAAFFDSLMQTSSTKGAVPIIESLLAQEGGEDYWNDLTQIVGILLRMESDERAGPDRLLEVLYNMSLHEQEDEELYQRRQNPDRVGVRILTMHASKGLEFGVVFALGLLKRSASPSQFINQRGKMVVALQKEDPLYYDTCKEVDAEKMRQLYVTMTRAKHRLYLQVIEMEECPILQPGTASPMEIFLGHFPVPLSQWIELSDAPITCEYLEPTELEHRREGEVLEPILDSPPLIHVPGQPRHMHSFTSLSKSLPTTGSTIHGSPHDFTAMEKTAHTLPAGSLTGTLLHELLEKMTHPTEIENDLASTPFAPWRDVIVTMIQSAFQAPLDDFCLADVKPLDMYKETEFMYTSDEGVIKGVIDLAFTYRGKYYLLDWKSNWLGPDEKSYSPEQLEATMQHHHYDLQARIYTEAFRRYLGLVENEPFEQVFGGVFYVFLRGLEAKETRGVYHVTRS